MVKTIGHDDMLEAEKGKVSIISLENERISDAFEGENTDHRKSVLI